MLETLEKVTGKLELVLARNPALAMVPVSVTTAIYDLLAKTETVKAIVDEADEALDDGRVQDARRLLDNLANEVVVSTTNLPMATYPDAIKQVATLIDSGKIDEAKQLPDHWMSPTEAGEVEPDNVDLEHCQVFLWSGTNKSGR